MISANNISVYFGGQELFDKVSFVVNKGDRIGLVGKNGAGKSTLLRLLSGEQSPNEGSISSPNDSTLGYLRQDLDFEEGRTVQQEAELAFKEIKELEEKINAINLEMSERTDYETDDYMQLITDLNELNERYGLLGGYTIQSEMSQVLLGLGFQLDDFSRQTNEFSGGWRMRLELAKILLSKPDVLLLDEPTNHLDAESVHWLEQHLQQYKGTVIAITHDRYFLDNVAGWILELDRGEGIPWKGNYSSWLDQKSKRLAQEEKQASKRRKTLERELDWVRMSPKGRQSKSKARLNNYDKLLSEENKQQEEKIELYIPAGPRLGTNVIEATSVSKAFGDKLLYEDLNFKLPPAGIVGIVGPNGAGKTTLFRMILGKEEADSGSFSIGETVKVSYVDQQHVDIDPEKTIWEQVTGGNELLEVAGKKVNSRSYVAKFNFQGSDQNKKVGVLSGGERNRLHLAMTLREEGNVLLLDEPTNDLDVNTLRALEDRS